jgi:hypothetical protein
MTNAEVMEVREHTHDDEETYNEKDLLRLLDEFMGRRAQAGGDASLLDSKRTITAVGLFIVNVGWILRLDENRYIHLPADTSFKMESKGLELVSNSSNGAQVYEQGKSSRSRRPGKR